jgi:hypothetical protein
MTPVTKKRRPRARMTSAAMRDGRPTIVGGMKVQRWSSQAITAETLGVSARQVRNLELRGLPSDGGVVSESKKRLAYPMPQAMMWFECWNKAFGPYRKRPEHLEIRFAIAWVKRRRALQAGATRFRDDYDTRWGWMQRDVRDPDFDQGSDWNQCGE